MAPRVSSPNVLFLSIDDLNDWVGFLGVNPSTVTPNIDALRRESLAFTKAYCTAPVCLASRSSVLFGAMPQTSGVFNHADPSLEAYARLEAGTPTLLQQLRDAGYLTVGAGKVFHDPIPERWDRYRKTDHYVSVWARDHPRYQPPSFDPDWLSPYSGAPIGRGDGDRSMIDFGPSGVSVDEEPDARTAAWVIDQLRGGFDQPFLLAYGTYLPHLPWRVPQKYLDMHPAESVSVPEIRPDDLDDLPAAAIGLVDKAGMLERLVDEGLHRQAVQGYLAAISFADDMVGRILDELAASPYADETAVVLWSDHGYHLGEKMHLRKFTLWERATRVPLLVRAPGVTRPGTTFDRPVSLVDVAPTVIDICGATQREGHDGRSLLPLIESPELADGRPPVTTWLAGNHAVRHGDWRYIRYADGATELYDHRADPGEFTNLAGNSAVRSVIDELDGFLPPRESTG